MNLKRTKGSESRILIHRDVLPSALLQYTVVLEKLKCQRVCFRSISLSLTTSYENPLAGGHGWLGQAMSILTRSSTCQSITVTIIIGATNRYGSVTTACFKSIHLLKLRFIRAYSCFIYALRQPLRRIGHPKQAYFVIGRNKIMKVLRRGAR